MIPKIIHYVWVGGNPLSPLAEKCIESWKKFCPDYEIKCWDETNFNINENVYCKEAYESKKWAFVSDYIRVKVLYEFGGIYMDADVEVIKPLDEYLNLKAFSGFESNGAIPTGIMASEKGNTWMEELLNYYKDKHFIKENGDLDLTTNVVTITNITKEMYPNIELNNTLQECADVVFFPNDVFCPFSYVDRKLHETENSHTIHWFAGSWVPKKNIFQKMWSGIKHMIMKIIGRENAQKLKAKLKRNKK